MLAPHLSVLSVVALGVGLEHKLYSEKNILNLLRKLFSKNKFLISIFLQDYHMERPFFDKTPKAVQFLLIISNIEEILFGYC